MADVASWLDGKDPSELDLIEFQGRTLYPDTIKRRDRKRAGEFVTHPIRLRTPNSPDKAIARVEALQWAGKLIKQAGGKPPEKMTIAAAEGLLGSVYFNELDNVALLARCIFEHEAPHDQYMLPEILANAHEHASLMDVWDRLCWYVDWEDVRVGELDEDAFMRVVASIDRVRNLSPLLGIGGSARDSCVISMAVRLQSYLTRSVSSPSTETSTQTVKADAD